VVVIGVIYMFYILVDSDRDAVSLGPEEFGLGQQLSLR